MPFKQWRTCRREEVSAALVQPRVRGYAIASAREARGCGLSGWARRNTPAADAGNSRATDSVQAARVMRPLDPHDDREAQMLAGGPSLAIEDLV